ncbi:MAG: Stage II sporulation protein E (SpoIIE) [Methanosaeta sp. PtaU1.Bin028]|nr:MAG: Stage II sporulation protein E (SpoIIE) [Methanosaeta sp. PtaU1.Bin028]
MSIDIDSYLELLQAACVIVLSAYLIIRSRYFAETLDKTPSKKSLLVLALFFGAVSIYGSLMGIRMMQAIASVRDLGPLAGGLFCGPVVGTGAGLIGAAFRLSQGGFTAGPCAVATLAAGLLGGLIQMRTRRFLGVPTLVGLAVLFEVLHMVLTLILARPFPLAMQAVEASMGPMVLANGAGMLVFAIVLSNYLAERRTQAERDRYLADLERERAEREVAAEIQMGFIPKSLPEIPGFSMAAAIRPALEVGGDFYDFPPWEIGQPEAHPGQESLGLAIADTAGKGVPAAIFMAHSRTVVRACISQASGPADALALANRLIEPEAGAGMFLTMFLGSLESDGHLRYANAGHPHSLLFRSGSREVVSLEVTGIALGLSLAGRYEERDTRLLAGDALVLYTDGLSEALNGGGEQYGSDRVRRSIASYAHLPAAEMLDGIISDWQAFCSGQPQFDDLTILVVKADQA